jgi:hypothetical protein
MLNRSFGYGIILVLKSLEYIQNKSIKRNADEN